MKETGKLGIILFAITAICAGLLGFINSVTLPIIQTQKETTKQEAMKQIMAEATEFKACEESSEEILELYAGLKDGEYVGAVAKIMPNGYGGGIEMMVGVSSEGIITAIQILAHTETPGLGANATAESFVGQYNNQKAPLKVVKGVAAEGEIAAITGSTITSDAVTRGVNTAAEYIITHQTEIMGGMQ